ncbi:hypothetical protein [Methylobacterium gregans]|uniref:hypothetical protein n=1 Tax=Methylobacterium gregans TaxID=374424 RepID=UPI003621D740
MTPFVHDRLVQAQPAAPAPERALAPLDEARAAALRLLETLQRASQDLREAAAPLLAEAQTHLAAWMEGARAGSVALWTRLGEAGLQAPAAGRPPPPSPSASLACAGAGPHRPAPAVPSPPMCAAPAVWAGPRSCCSSGSAAASPPRSRSPAPRSRPA